MLITVRVFLIFFSLTLFAQKKTWAERVFEKMSLEEKVGQLFWIKCPATYQSYEDKDFAQLIRYVEEGKIGGIMLTKGNIYTAAVHIAWLQKKSKIPLLVSADMEWGVAMRIEETSQFPIAMAIAATRNFYYAHEVGKITGLEARAIGIHLNFAPVVDINDNPNNPVINTRSFGENIDLINKLSVAFIKGSHEANMLTTVKHFPGHGNTNIDSHKDLPTLPFGYEDLMKKELQTFKVPIDSGVDAVMVGHLSLPKITNSNSLPSCLSSEIIETILKKNLKFKGLVISDALDMDGVRKNYSETAIPLLAMNAGCEVFLTPKNIETAYNSLVNAIQFNKISLPIFNNAVLKILRLKEKIGLDTLSKKNTFEQIPQIVSLAASQSLQQEIADKSITLLKNDHASLPLFYGKKNIVNISIQNTITQQVGRTFYNELDKDIKSPYLKYIRIDDESNEQAYSDALITATKSNVVIVSCYVESRNISGQIILKPKQDDFLRKMIEKLEKKKITLILVCFGTPYIVASYSKADVLLCAYQSNIFSERAVVKTILGTNNPLGRLPITIPPYFKYGDGMSY